jgi:hypothetical protein
MPVSTVPGLLRGTRGEVTPILSDGVFRVLTFASSVGQTTNIPQLPSALPSNHQHESVQKLPARNHLVPAGFKSCECQKLNPGNHLVVVVEDELVTRLVACATLRDAGFNVIETDHIDQGVGPTPNSLARNTCDVHRCARPRLDGWLSSRASLQAHVAVDRAPNSFGSSEPYAARASNRRDIPSEALRTRRCGHTALRVTFQVALVVHVGWPG